MEVFDFGCHILLLQQVIFLGWCNNGDGPLFVKLT